MRIYKGGSAIEAWLVRSLRFDILSFGAIIALVVLDTDIRFKSRFECPEIRQVVEIGMMRLFLLSKGKGHTFESCRVRPLVTLATSKRRRKIAKHFRALGRCAFCSSLHQRRPIHRRESCMSVDEVLSGMT
jgi:hypothetical protein